MRYFLLRLLNHFFPPKQPTDPEFRAYMQGVKDKEQELQAQMLFAQPQITQPLPESLLYAPTRSPRRTVHLQPVEMDPETPPPMKAIVWMGETQQSFWKADVTRRNDIATAHTQRVPPDVARQAVNLQQAIKERETERILATEQPKAILFDRHRQPDSDTLPAHCTIYVRCAPDILLIAGAVEEHLGQYGVTPTRIYVSSANAQFMEKLGHNRGYFAGTHRIQVDSSPLNDTTVVCIGGQHAR